MNILIFGAAGFIGTNLTMNLAKDKKNNITVIDYDSKYFKNIEDMRLENVHIKIANFDVNTDFVSLIQNQDIVYHLVNSNNSSSIASDIENNVITTSYMLDACVECKVKRVIFISSGGTVYGKTSNFPIQEEDSTNPISSYALQKLMIEKLLYVYNYTYNLDYRIIRLSNPYGPYQRPDGKIGVINTFIYKILRNEEIILYGDGSVVRDFIYIDDAINGIINIANDDKQELKIFNIGSGKGTSIKELLNILQNILKKEMLIDYRQGRISDVPINYLDISRYESIYGKLNNISLEEGIIRTKDFLQNFYKII